VIVETDIHDPEQYDSPEHQEVKKLREGAAHLRIVAVEGV
jgi:uncharacterized protein (DUF1330 family)